MGEKVHHQRQRGRERERWRLASGWREEEIVHARHFTENVGQKINWASRSLSSQFFFFFFFFCSFFSKRYIDIVVMPLLLLAHVWPTDNAPYVVSVMVTHSHHNSRVISSNAAFQRSRYVAQQIRIADDASGGCFVI